MIEVYVHLYARPGQTYHVGTYSSWASVFAALERKLHNITQNYRWSINTAIRPQAIQLHLK